jgi:hypothetical protein
MKQRRADFAGTLVHPIVPVKLSPFRSSFEGNNHFLKRLSHRSGFKFVCPSQVGIDTTVCLFAFSSPLSPASSGRPYLHQTESFDLSEDGQIQPPTHRSDVRISSGISSVVPDFGRRPTSRKVRHSSDAPCPMFLRRSRKDSTRRDNTENHHSRTRSPISLVEFAFPSLRPSHALRCRGQVLLNARLNNHTPPATTHAAMPNTIA